jgi:hypothetical protein
MAVATISGGSVRLERPIDRFVEKCSIAKAYMWPDGRRGRRRSGRDGPRRNAVLQNGIVPIRTPGMD